MREDEEFFQQHYEQMEKKQSKNLNQKDNSYYNVNGLKTHNFEFFISKTKNSKYFGGMRNSTKKSINNTNNQSPLTQYLNNKQQSLDILYIIILIKELIPHILLCYQLLYSNLINNKLIQNKLNNLNYTYNELFDKKIERLFDAKDVFSKDIYSIYEELWNKFENNGLLPQNMLALPKTIETVVTNTKVEIVNEIASVTNDIIANSSSLEEIKSENVVTIEPIVEEFIDKKED